MIKIVTDSASDLPVDIAKELGIEVVPLLVRFGSDVYRDRVDISVPDFYQKLENSSVMPSTSTPPPGVFAEVFDNLAEKYSQIMGIFLSRKFSATCEAALQGMKLMKRKCQVEIVDSRIAIMGQGLIVMEAAKRALSGAGMKELTDMISETVPKTHVRVTLDTLKYLARGGRIGKVQALLGSVLKINPIIGIKDGEAFPFGRVRSRAKAMEWFYDFLTNLKKVKALAVEYGTNITEARAFADRLASMFPKTPIYLSNISPVIGTHTGPSLLSLTAQEE